MKNTVTSYAKHFEDFQTSLEELKELIDQAKSKNQIEKYRPTIVEKFEKTHDLALDTLHAYFREQGRPPFSGSRDATVEAFNEDLIDDGEGWLDMIICRIKYNPIYPGDYLDSLSEHVVKSFQYLLGNFERNFKNKTNL